MWLRPDRGDVFQSAPHAPAAGSRPALGGTVGGNQIRRGQSGSRPQTAHVIRPIRFLTTSTSVILFMLLPSLLITVTSQVGGAIKTNKKKRGGGCIFKTLTPPLPLSPSSDSLPLPLFRVSPHPLWKKSRQQSSQLSLPAGVAGC